MPKTLICALLLAACGGEPPDPDRNPGSPPPPDDTDTDTDTDTHGTTPEGTIEASCAVDPTNVLRYACTVTVDPPSAVTITLQKAEGGTARTYTSPEVKAEHALTLVLMAPRTDYRWTATADDDLTFEGSFTTEALPKGAQALLTVIGTASFPYFLSASPCSEGAFAILASSDGEVLWYHNFGKEVFSFVDSLSYTEDGTVIAIADGSVVEVDLLGNELMRLEHGVDFDQVVHHDVFRKDGYTWVLHKDFVVHEGDQFALDGFYVFDSGGALVADWRLYDHHVPVGPAGGFGGNDYSHANSLWVDDAGGVLLSMRHLSAIAYLDGDLTSPDFGTILWRMGGDPAEPKFGTDFTLTSAAPEVASTFEQQHNVHLVADDTLAMFDNRNAWNDPSRLVHVSFDLATGQAVIEQEYVLPVHCDFQGGAWHSAAGNPVATCAPIAKAFEFDLGVPDTPRWTADLDCFSGAGAYVPRVIPLEESDL